MDIKNTKEVGLEAEKIFSMCTGMISASRDVAVFFFGPNVGKQERKVCKGAIDEILGQVRWLG